MTYRHIVIYDKSTGEIRQTVMCPARDAHIQHLAWPNHYHADVTDIHDCHGEPPHPDRHTFCTKTKRLLRRDPA